MAAPAKQESPGFSRGECQVQAPTNATSTTPISKTSAEKFNNQGNLQDSFRLYRSPVSIRNSGWTFTPPSFRQVVSSSEQRSQAKLIG